MGGRPATTGAFAGFPEEAQFFYQGLEADNSRTYWTAHLDQYERAVRDPMLALLAELEPEFGPGKLFRPNRDLRFSADKSPYKTHAGVVLRPDDGSGVLYVQISAGGLMVAGGYYQVSGPQLARYRAAVLADVPGTELAAITGRLVRGGASLVALGRLQRAPRGVDPAHPRIDLLRMKGIAASRDFGAPPWLGTRECLKRVAACWRTFAPLNDWLGQHVGADDPIPE